jgi:PAS domain S-box-containing protein
MTGQEKYGMGLFLLYRQLGGLRMAGKLSYEELEQKVKELEKKAVECEKVKDALKLFSHAFESSIDGLAMGNNENRFTYANETFAKMFGYSREELVGKEIALIYADDQIPLLEKAFKITMDGGWTGELIGKKKDGRRFPVSVSSTRVLDDKGNVITHMASHRDITEQKQTVETLRESEEKYRTLFEDSRDAITITTRNGKYIAFNQSFLDLFGYTKEDMRDMKAEEKYLDPNGRATFKKEVEEKGSVKDFEATLKKKDGTKIYALITATLWTAPDGSFQGYQNIVRDITEQKLAEEALRESEEKWRSLAETTPCVILTVQRDGTIQFLNRTIGNYTLENTVGTKVWDYVPPDHHSVMRKAIEHVFQTGLPIGYQILGAGIEGPASTWYMTHLGPILKDGKVVAVTMASADITEIKKVHEELRESEEKWRTLFNDSRDAIYITTRDGEFIDFNQSLLDLFGYTVEEMRKIKAVDLYVDPNGRATFKKEVEEKGSVKDFEATLKKKDGTKIYALMTSTLWLAPDGSILGYQGIIRDVTEQKKTLEALRESEAQKKGILDASVDRIRLSDTDMRIIWANQAHERELNIHPDEFIGQHCYAFFVKRDTPCLECPSIKALASGNIEHSVLPRPSPGNKGETTYLDSYAVPIKNKSGDIESCIQITRNITEQVQAEKALRKSEEKYRTILESIEEGYYELDLTGNFTFFNNSTCKMLGYRRNELLGMNNREYTDKKNAKKIYKIFNRVYKTGKSKNIADIEIIRKNAGRRNIETSVSLMTDSEGNATGFRGIFRDVTESKQAERAIIKREAELSSVNKQLIETNRALSVLAKNLDTTQKESEKRVIQKIRNYIMPIIEKLREDKNIERYRADFDLLTSYIRGLTSDLADDIKIALSLSNTELRVASLIRNGMSNQEIAMHLYVTLATVKTHRRNIRRKLDLHNSGINLKAYMKSELDQE